MKLFLAVPTTVLARNDAATYLIDRYVGLQSQLREKRATATQRRQHRVELAAVELALEAAGVAEVIEHAKRKLRAA